MPLTSAIQSAMAVRAEREKRHQRRLSKIRRESGAGAHARSEHGSGGARGEHGHGASLVCTKRQSVASTGTLEEAELRPPPDKADSMVTTFHLGIVFILLGFIMILSSMIPSTIIKERCTRTTNKLDISQSEFLSEYQSKICERYCIYCFKSFYLSLQTMSHFLFSEEPIN